MNARFLAIGAIAATSIVYVSAQQVRDNAGTRVGTGIIAGTVVTDEVQSHPLRRVTVTLSNGELRVPASTVTDDTGAFVFPALAPGNYTVIATRSTYVPTFYGSTHPGRGPGLPVAVLDGQRQSIVVKMLPGAVITGVVRSTTGRPAPNVPVEVVALQTLNGARKTNASTDLQGWVTDDQGVYRAFGLAPGDYIVMARPSIADARRLSESELTWGQQVTAPPRGATTGAPQATPTPLPDAPPAGQSVNYVPVYFPGTADPSLATPVTVRAGDERTGVDFNTLLVPTAKITGIVFDVDGQPMPAVTISLVAAATDFVAQSDILVNMMMGITGGGRTGGDGKFTLANVKPGRYTIQVRGTPRAPGGRAAGAGQPDLGAMMGAMMPGMSGGGGATGTLWAQDDLVVDGRDIGDLSFKLQPGMSVAGSVTFSAPSTRALPDFSKSRVMLAPPATGNGPLEIAMSLMSSFSPTAGVPIAADGTFKLNGVTPGNYRLSVTVPDMMTGSFGTWTLLSAMLNGRDVSDQTLEIKPNTDVSGLVVTFSDRSTELSGTVVDGAGRVSGTFPIVVFSTDRGYWHAASRRVKPVRPASDGTFKITGLPPGEYYMGVVTDADPNVLNDPSFLEQLAAASLKIMLAEGEKKVQSVKLGGG